MFRLLVVLSMFFVLGCATRYDVRDAFDEGVVYGARTLYNGDLDEDIILTRAYRLKYDDKQYEKEFQNWINNVNKTKKRRQKYD